MQMSTNEIVRMYKEAADKKKQIPILADLNACTVEEIRAELVKGGIDPRTLPRKRRTPGEATQPDAAPTSEEKAKADGLPVKDTMTVELTLADLLLLEESLQYYAGDVEEELAEHKQQVRILTGRHDGIMHLLDLIGKRTGTKS